MKGVLGGLEPGSNSLEKGEIGHEERLRVWQGTANMGNMLIRQLGEAVTYDDTLDLQPKQRPYPTEQMMATVTPIRSGIETVALTSASDVMGNDAINPDVPRRAIEDLYKQAA